MAATTLPALLLGGEPTRRTRRRRTRAGSKALEPAHRARPGRRPRAALPARRRRRRGRRPATRGAAVRRAHHLRRHDRADRTRSSRLARARAGPTAACACVDAARRASRHDARHRRARRCSSLPLAGACRGECRRRDRRARGRAERVRRVTDFAYVPRDCARSTVTAPAAAGSPSRPRGASVGSRSGTDGARTCRSSCAAPAAAAARSTTSRTAGVVRGRPLIACEVLTPAGNWSSYPPHKHDEDRPGTRACSRRSTTSRSPTARTARGSATSGSTAPRTGRSTCSPRCARGDVVLVPHGWHGPSMAAPGYDLYYLNVMAGPGDRARLADLRRPGPRLGARDLGRPADRPAPPPDHGPDERSSTMSSTVRLTVAQALVRFLGAQYTRARRRRAAAVRRAASASSATATSPASARRCCRRSCERPGRAAVLPGPQRAGAWCTPPSASPGCATGCRPRLHGIDRPGRDQHGHRRGARHDQPAAGAAAARRRVRHPGRGPGAAGARELPRAATSRVNDAFRPVSKYFDRVWRPEQLPVGAAGRDARADRPGRDRRGDARAAAGRAGRGATTGRTSSSPSGSGTSPGRCPRHGCVGPRRRAHPRRAAAADRRRRRRASTPRRPRRCARSPRPPASRSRRPRPARDRCRYDHPQSLGAVGATGTTAANALAREADVVIGIGTRYSDFTTASRTAFAEPGRAVRQHQRRARSTRHKHAGRAARRRRPRGAWRRSTAALGGWTGRPATTASASRPSWRASGTPPSSAPTDARPLAAACAARGHRRGQRRRRPPRRRGLRRRLDARRPAQAVADPRPEGLPRRVRLLLHGLRDRRRARRQASAAPGPRVFVMVGDGSYLMMAHELVTAVQEGVKLIVVLVQNHGFASIGALSESLGSQRFGTPYRRRTRRRTAATATCCRSTWPPTPRASAPT